MGYKIEYIEDGYECDTCGYNYASGYVIYKDEVVVVDKTPVAACYGGLHYERDDAVYEILKLEGIEVETNYDYGE